MTKHPVGYDPSWPDYDPTLPNCFDDPPGSEARDQFLSTARLDLPDYELARILGAMRAKNFWWSARSLWPDIWFSIASVPLSEIHPALRNAIIRIAYHYRRQLPGDVLAIITQRWSNAVFMSPERYQ